MSPDDIAPNSHDGHTVKFHTPAAAGHLVPVGKQQQPFPNGNRSRHSRLSCHLQRRLLLAHVLRQQCLSALCRLTIGKRHHSPGDDPELSHFLFFLHGILL